MRIEHLAFNVENAPAMADWYVANLKMKIVKAVEAPTPIRFLADDAGQVVLEFYTNPKAPVPDYKNMDPLVLHVAFAVPDVESAFATAIESGATAQIDPFKTKIGDSLAMLRDPWGLAVQLVCRVTPLI